MAVRYARPRTAVGIAEAGGGHLLVKQTWSGDANLDGKINVDDYGRIDFNVGIQGAALGGAALVSRADGDAAALVAGPDSIPWPGVKWAKLSEPNESTRDLLA